jgi:hypothetical protein
MYGFRGFPFQISAFENKGLGVFEDKGVGS